MDRDTVKVVGYVRVSTDSQVRHGYSLDEQREEIERYCNIQNYNLLEIFSDEGGQWGEGGRGRNDGSA